ncbi:hypothetical protein BCU22_019155 [Vibrio cyclitrophicus]|uniref:hypothetical protein n=1 Tax=Vibrio cyclitrophicus TaxID=47951 RepID=UPI001F537DA8|nr:hypothetical protein [Vibrio cyclitrophicus]
MNKQFSGRDSLRKWLASISGVIISTIVLVNDIDKLVINTTNPKMLSQLIHEHPSEFPDKPYLVSFEKSEDQKSDVSVDYSKMVMVTAMEATLARNGRRIGGLEPLLKELGSYQYCCTSMTKHPAYKIAGLWVVQPTMPNEIEELKAILDKFAMSYAFSDGSGFMTLSNFRFNDNVLSVYPDMLSS